ncbi:MAG: M36 family metallopeptidase [Actinomycetota bacterium]
MRPSRSAILLSLTLLLGLLPSLGSSAEVGAGRDGSAIDIALTHVRTHRSALGLTKADLAGLFVTDAYRDAHNGVTHVYLGQRHEGLEVVGGTMTVNIDRGGRVIYAPSALVGGVAGTASGQMQIGADRAVELAAAQLGLSTTRALRFLRVPSGAEQRGLLSDGGISVKPIPAALVYQATNVGVRLAWRLEIEEISGRHWWIASVDASNGRMLDAVDLVDHDNIQTTSAAVGAGARGDASSVAIEPPDPATDGAKYRVYALPFESPNDGPRTVVTNPADRFGSPFGWHDTNGAAGAEATRTVGNNVHAYVDPTPGANTALPLMDADGGSGLNFDFPIDFALPPTAWKDAAVTNLFYWNNILHDVTYRYGFNEVSGNFQVNNYGHDGAANDSVQAEAQDGSGTNNANFGTPVDGQRPRMQMYLWTSTAAANQRLIDGDLDAGVIIHEGTHGISNRLTGGPSQGGCLSHQEREGEGWSDWLALAMTTLPGESGAQPRGMGPYVLGQANRQGAGIRPTRYTTNMAINGATYDDVKTLAVPHGVGYVWATMLWEMYWNFVAEYGFNPDVYGDWTTGGNNLAIQLVMDGMKFQPCSPGFVDARDAILAANAALTDGAAEAVNSCLIWRAFAKRGLGLNADQGSPTSRSDGTEDFELPTECAT